jgi:hypothetical protein
MGRRLKQVFLKRRQMVDGYMKTCLTSISIREMKIKTTEISPHHSQNGYYPCLTSISIREMKIKMTEISPHHSQNGYYQKHKR